MNIRILTKEDAAIYRELRLEALQKHPSAFGSSYEEAVHRTVEQIQGTFPEEKKSCMSTSYGLEKRALKVDDVYLDEKHMGLFL